MLAKITPLIITFDEAPNLRRALDKLVWARQVVVLDSYSTDETESIARSFANVVFVQRKFDTFAAQCNFGIDRIQTDWVLSLDADYVVTDELLSEIAQLPSEPGVSAYIARFRYCVAGRPLRGSLYPPRAVLFQKPKGHYVQDGHAHKLVFDSSAKVLKGYLLHDDRKPLARWLESQRSYAAHEAQKLIERRRPANSLADRIRQWIWPAAPAAFVYTLLIKRCICDGWPGWYYALQRTYAELLLSLEILDRRLNCHGVTPDSSRTDSQLND
jgi:glycosyltransferase involved in cell wall biosynthesis